MFPRGCPTRWAACGDGRWSGDFLRLSSWMALGYLMFQPTCPYILLYWITVPMAGCLSRRPFAWPTFKFDGAVLRGNWPCIYSERSLVVCGKELGPGAEATISRTKPQNLHICLGSCVNSAFPFAFPAEGLCHHPSAAFLSALVIAVWGKNLFCSIQQCCLDYFNVISCWWFITIFSASMGLFSINNQG